MVLKLYYDLLSQPSRALYIFFKKAGIPFEPCIVNLAKGWYTINNADIAHLSQILL